MSSARHTYSRRRFLQTLGAGGLLMGSPGAGFSGLFEWFGKKPFRVVFFTDVHARKEWKTPEALQIAADAINALKPNLVIGGGDLITDGFSYSAESVEHRWDIYFDFERSIEAPVHCAIGNHDLVGAIPVDGSEPAEDPRSVFLSRYGLERTYRSFDAGGYHFVLLDTIDLVGGKLKYRGWVDEKQLEWLKNDISGENMQKPVILVTHMPLLTGFYDYDLGPEAPAPANRVVINAHEVLNLFKNRRLLAVLQGHLHVNEYLMTRGTAFITGGAVCAKWWRGPYFGTYEGFAVLDLDGDVLRHRYITYPWDVQRPKNR